MYCSFSKKERKNVLLEKVRQKVADSYCSFSKKERKNYYNPATFLRSFF
jgi:hypothetical protein